MPATSIVTLMDAGEREDDMTFLNHAWAPYPPRKTFVGEFECPCGTYGSLYRIGDRLYQVFIPKSGGSRTDGTIAHSAPLLGAWIKSIGSTAYTASTRTYRYALCNR